MQTMHECARGLSPCIVGRPQLWSGINAFGLERAVAAARAARCCRVGSCRLQRRGSLIVSVSSHLFVDGVGSRPGQWRGFLAFFRVRLEIPMYGRNTDLRFASRSWKKEFGEHAIENGRFVSSGTEDRPKRVADSGLARKGHDLERSRGIMTLSGADPESMIAPKDVAERDQIVGKVSKRVHLATPRRDRSDPEIGVEAVAARLDR